MGGSSNERGFQLLELVVALGIVSVLAGVTMAGANRWLPGIRLEQASAEIVASLRHARARAVAFGRPVEFVLDLPGRRWSVDGAARGLPAGVEFDPSRSTRVRDDRLTIRFQPGGYTSDNATIAVRSGSAARRIVVSSAGRVRWE